MAPVTYIVSTEETSPKFGRAFAQGCGGAIADVRQGLQAGNFASFCTPPTWPLLRLAQANDRDWYYGDHAFYQRGLYYRVTRNGYQYQPTAAALAAATPDRFRACHQTIYPRWRHGKHIVVCPNSDIYMQQHGFPSAHDWTMDVVRQIAEETDREVIVRWKVQSRRRPIKVDLEHAWACVVYNSNSAVDALMMGVPIFVLCPWASTVSMGQTDLIEIENPLYPDNRESFLWALATQQWTLVELAAGRAWRDLQR